MQNITIYFTFYFFIIRIYWYITCNTCWYNTSDICWYNICHICWYTISNVFNFITRNYRINNNILNIAILANTCPKIQTIIFLHRWYFLHLHWHLSYHFLFELHLVLLNLHLPSHEGSFTNVFVSFILVTVLNTSTFMSFILLGTHIFIDKSSTALQLPLQLSGLIMNGLSSTGFKSTRVG